MASRWERGWCLGLVGILEICWALREPSRNRPWACYGQRRQRRGLRTAPWRAVGRAQYPPPFLPARPHPSCPWCPKAPLPLLPRKTELRAHPGPPLGPHPYLTFKCAPCIPTSALPWAPLGLRGPQRSSGGQIGWEMEHPAAGEARLDGIQTQFRGLPNPHPRRVPRCREARQ